MRFNREAEIAINLVSSLGEKAKPLAVVANHHQESLDFLHHIACKLRKAGLITAKRGRSGGYAKTKPVNAWEIMQALKLTPKTRKHSFGFVCDRMEMVLRQTNI